MEHSSQQQRRRTPTTVKVVAALSALVGVSGLAGIGRQLVALSDTAEAEGGHGVLNWITLIVNAAIVVVCAASLVLLARSRSY